jgi:hypothetical protein
LPQAILKRVHALAARLKASFRLKSLSSGRRFSAPSAAYLFEPAREFEIVA